MHSVSFLPFPYDSTMITMDGSDKVDIAAISAHVHHEMQWSNELKTAKMDLWIL